MSKSLVSMQAYTPTSCTTFYGCCIPMTHYSITISSLNTAERAVPSESAPAKARLTKLDDAVDPWTADGDDGVSVSARNKS
jgi:hypothetical protein